MVRGRVPVADSGPRTTSVRGVVYVRGDLYREALEALRRIADGEQLTEKYGSEAVHDGEGWKEAVYLRPISVQEFARRVLSRAEGET